MTARINCPTCHGTGRERVTRLGCQWGGEVTHEIESEIDCESCGTTGKATCYGCNDAPADRVRGGWPLCGDCEIVSRCECGLVWTRGEWRDGLPERGIIPGARTR